MNPAVGQWTVWRRPFEYVDAAIVEHPLLRDANLQRIIHKMYGAIEGQRRLWTKIELIRFGGGGWTGRRWARLVAITTANRDDADQCPTQVALHSSPLAAANVVQCCLDGPA